MINVERYSDGEFHIDSIGRCSQVDYDIEDGVISISGERHCFFDCRHDVEIGAPIISDLCSPKYEIRKSELDRRKSLFLVRGMYSRKTWKKFKLVTKDFTMVENGEVE